MLSRYSRPVSCRLQAIFLLTGGDTYVGWWRIAQNMQRNCESLRVCSREQSRVDSGSQPTSCPRRAHAVWVMWAMWVCPGAKPCGRSGFVLLRPIRGGITLESQLAHDQAPRPPGCKCINASLRPLVDNRWSRESALLSSPPYWCLTT